MSNPNNPNPIDPGLYCFITIARFHNIAAEPEQIKHTFAVGDNMSETDILRASRSVGLKSKSALIDLKRLKKMPLPAILITKENGFIIIAKVENENMLILYPSEAAPRLIDENTLTEQWNGRIILFVPRVIKEENQKFGFKWFIPTIIKYKRVLTEVIVSSLTIQILGLFGPIITQVVLDKVLVHNSITTLDVLAIALISLAVFEALMTFAKSYIFTHTVSKIDVILGSKLFSHLLALPLRYFEVRRVGDTVARVRELENIRRFLTGAPLTALLDTLFIFVYIIVMFIYSSNLTFIVLGSLPCFVLLSAIVTPLFKVRLDEKFNCGAEEQSYLVEAVTGIQTIKSYALEPESQKRWEVLLSNYAKANFKTSILSGNAGAIGQLLQKVFDVIILWVGATMVMQNKLSVGQLIAFRMMASRVSSPVLRLVQTWQEFQQASISVKRLGDIFNTKPEPTVDSSKAMLPSIKGRIRFEKVRFRYRLDGSEVIRDMSFDIKPNTIVGVVGRSGSGKSTISKLIQRMYIPEAGKILIDGVDLSLASPSWLRRQIGVVLQENFLFNLSIKDNICIHKPTASMEEIIRVATIAGAHEFILELPESYDTVVGERGTALSGGQKQRIAIARALINNPRILIFDEATSALDYESESIIQKNLSRICQGRTVIIIAHRLSTLRDAHEIIVIDKGHLVERGSREELIQKKGLYYYLHLKQEEGISNEAIQ